MFQISSIVKLYFPKTISLKTVDWIEEKEKKKQIFFLFKKASHSTIIEFFRWYKKCDLKA